MIAPAVWLRLDCSASWSSERMKSAGESEPDTFLPCKMLNNARPNPQNNSPWALDPTAPSFAKCECAGRTRLAFREVAAAPQMPRVHPAARVRLFILDLLDITATGFKTRLPRRLFSRWLIWDGWQTTAFDSAPVGAECSWSAQWADRIRMHYCQKAGCPVAAPRSLSVNDSASPMQRRQWNVNQPILLPGTLIM